MSIPLTTGIETLKIEVRIRVAKLGSVDRDKSGAPQGAALPKEHSRESGCVPMLGAGFLAGALKSARKLIAVNNPPLGSF
jgi:hypothetical protein